jgi:[ribosomal protein S5]-alanine N-acetyltransferase
LRIAGPEEAAAVRDFGVRSREFHAPWDPIRSADFWDLPQVAERLRVQTLEAQQQTSLCLVFSDKNDPVRIIGVANLRNIIRGAMLGCHLGYALAPDATGRGFMTEAVERIVRIAFDELALHRVEANVIPRNVRSIAVLERAGFSPEGVSPRYLRIAGVWEDHVRYGIINEDLR